MADTATLAKLIALAGKVDAAYQKAMSVLDRIEDAEAREASPDKIEALELKYADANARAGELRDDFEEMASHLFDEFDEEHEIFWATR